MSGKVLSIVVGIVIALGAVFVNGKLLPEAVAIAFGSPQKQTDACASVIKEAKEEKVPAAADDVAP